MRQIVLYFFLIAVVFSGTLSLSLFPRRSANRLHKRADEDTEDTISRLTEVIGNPVDPKKVKFFLHTSTDYGYLDRIIDPSKLSELSPTNGKVYILNHGWTQSRETTPWFRPLTEFLLEHSPNANVIQVDWKKPAAQNYTSAAFSTESVGNIVGDFIKKLVREGKVPVKSIVVIGHSLGAHVSGWIGKRFYEITNMKLPRIIALDPAGPLFSERPDEKRLNRNDAEVVMVVHTNAGNFGIADPTGTIDFFPNGGSDQPGCTLEDTKKRLNPDDPVWCPHQRAYNLFVQAVMYPQYFFAKKCKNYNEFKENECEDEEVSLGDLETTEKGLFYLETTGETPFFKTSRKQSQGTNSRKRTKICDEPKKGFQTVDIHENLSVIKKMKRRVSELSRYLAE